MQKVRIFTGWVGGGGIVHHKMLSSIIQVTSLVCDNTAAIIASDHGACSWYIDVILCVHCGMLTQHVAC